MTQPETRDAADIAWLRNLAEEGAATPPRGGSILMAAGLVYGLASLAHWAAVTRLIDAGYAALPVIWLGATALFVAINVIVVARMRGRQGVQTAAGRVFGAVWSAVGLGIVALFLSLFVNDWAMGPHQGAGFWLVPSIIMVFYGLGWAVSAAMTRSRSLGVLAGASFLAAPLLAALTGQNAQYLAYAACLFALMAVPGWLLMRKAGRA